MIISDPHRFAFIHIPKCAGSAIRSQLSRYDSYEGRFSQKGIHPELGQVDLSHLPLSTLRDFFPGEFEKLNAYRSFAVVRNPYTRFLSAVLQHVQEFEKATYDELHFASVASRASQIADRLEAGEGRRPEFVHFTRQSDFVAIDGRRVVPNLFAFEDIAPFALALQNEFGMAFDVTQRLNKSLVQDRAPLRVMRRAIGPTYRRVVSEGVRNRINRAINKARIIKTPEALYEKLLGRRELRGFIEEYYADDLALHRSLAVRRNGTP
ncbi:MAG TPA: sulfotransferase family 2 domain-containing protein [Rhizomicrobium sp.]|jgi:hypothetical protein|nr:sulfotransferase family 2 domain-containing protein [Rhizomicrobium sp.]